MTATSALNANTNHPDGPATSLPGTSLPADGDAGASAAGMAGAATALAADAPADGSADGAIGAAEAADFAVKLLQALIAMAARSKRRQADLTAALHGAGLPGEPLRVRAALRVLLAQGAIDNLVPLSDGGLLLSVTRQGLERAAPSPRWLPLDELDGEAG